MSVSCHQLHRTLARIYKFPYTTSSTILIIVSSKCVGGCFWFCLWVGSSMSSYRITALADNSALSENNRFWCWKIWDILKFLYIIYICWDQYKLTGHYWPKIWFVGQKICMHDHVSLKRGRLELPFISMCTVVIVFWIVKGGGANCTYQRVLPSTLCWRIYLCQDPAGLTYLG